jgi:hypothetical protein
MQTKQAGHEKDGRMEKAGAQKRRALEKKGGRLRGPPDFARNSVP